MCKGKVLLGTILGVAAVAALSMTLLGTNADAQCCGSSKTTAVKAPAAEVPAGCPVSKVATATVSPSPAGGTSDAPACGMSDEASSCPMGMGSTAAGKVKAAKGKSLPTLQQIHARQLPGALKAIDAALKALEKGDRATALRQLTVARLNLQTAQVALAKHVGPTFVNAVCPLMGSPIKAEKVTASLTREYKGQKVAFCCGGCPARWDKLTDAQKEAKLVNAKAKPSPVSVLKLKP